MNKTEINIIFSTKNIENTTNLLWSILEKYSLKKIKNYSLTITIFDKTLTQNILTAIKQFDLCINVIGQSKIKELEEKHSKFIYSANCSTKIDSIQRARIQQQIYIIENYDQFKDSIIWQVDDDILFGKSNYKKNQHTVTFTIDYFSKIVEFYNENKSIDAIIAPTSYVPPIPSLLYCKTQLEDVFNGEYIARESFNSEEYHDYYNQNNTEKYYSIFLSETQDKNEIVKSILAGKPITKVAFNEKENLIPKQKKSKLLRGGNFIVFNIDVFRIPHFGFSENNHIPARRSDMIHSHLLLELGFNVVDVNYFTLVHNRSFANSSIENSTEKYFSDMIGSLLIQYLYKGKKEFDNRFQFHQNHIKKILKLLYENINENEFRTEIGKLKELDVQINSLDKEHFINEFEDFKRIKNQLIIKLCKLAS
ncbi:hypothetical protein H0I29_01205 [Polaribacter sp. R2A056_3_33]|uniref:hypothetical protein n=1 Tax=Polaribacter sp. R2A056_3_33 TaxID=2745563 RepID=UPI001C4E7148|nr:hypothetical protein [Polaribacter sp. R2A056_3_33]QXP70742.1 hypothetical protein H0I29_01205 [Polaribacter sp. R2A056_3_33]